MSEPGPDSEETLFSSALRCPPAERAAFLDKACAGQPALRRRIEELLGVQRQLGDFMATRDDRGVGRPPSISASLEELPGGRIGRYRILQKIGEGGCGVVYLAEQQEAVRRQVALKVIKLGMDTKNVIARFEAERQALALMDHPNIAKVFDAGATPSGRPYFVMELVRGTRITEFCDRNRLSTGERLDLFVQVCEAVQHAHQKGIIHRDLKPSNILVTVHNPGDPGSPRIIDFGIAKATQGRLTDQTLFTAFEHFLGTPAYMSPEQASLTTQDIDTRSDIYSLGVLLYELLTGCTPFDAKRLLTAGLEELRRTIQDQEPVRPSTRLGTLLDVEQTTAARVRGTDPLKLVQLLRGDLDWIVMKCLEKDRARRYETANGLAMDVRRHLGGEPVLARPPSRLYVFQKTVRRHKAGFVATAAVMSALAAGVIVSGLAAVRARRAEAKARQTGYFADMNLADRALEEGDLRMSQTYLRRHAPGPRETDLRNWEWRYLANLSDGDPHVPLVAHSSHVSSFRFLDDNTLLTAGKADYRAVLWNLKERRPSTVFTSVRHGGSFSEVVAVSLRRHAMYYRAAWRRSSRVTVVGLGSDAVTDPDDGTGILFDAGSPIVSLDISPAQDMLAVAYSNRVGLWDLDRNIWSSHVETESGPATQGLFSPDGFRLAVVDESGRVALWNPAESKKLGVLTNAPPGPGSMRFSADGRWLVNPGGDTTCQIWNVEDRTPTARLHDSASVERAVFSPDGRWLATVGGDTSIRLWQTSDWRKVRTLRGHTDPVTAVDFSPDSHALATGARNGEVKLWSLDEPANASERIAFPAAQVVKLACDNAGFGLIHLARGTNGLPRLTAEVWTISPPHRAFTVDLPEGQPSSGVVLRGGRGLVLGGFDGGIRLFGAEGRIQWVVNDAHAGEVYLMDVSSDGSTLVTKGMRGGGIPEGRVRFWRLPQLEPITEWHHFANVHAIKLSDDGRLLAGFTGDGDVGVWEVPSMKGAPMWRGLATLQEPRDCAFSPDKRWLAAVTDDGDAYLWNLSTHRRTVFPRSMATYHSLSFSPDGTRLAAGSDGESKLFDTATGQTVLSFRLPGLQLGFTQDGERLLAVHRLGASVFHAPPFQKLQFDWMRTPPTQDPPPFRGPDPGYERPDRPRAVDP